MYKNYYIRGYLFLLFCLVSLVDSHAQDKSNIKKIEKEAYQHAISKEWYFALPLYEKLNNLQPENADYAFSTGQCYFNTDNKAKGLSFFKQAAKQGHTSPLLEFYLGRAYHFNLIFDSAILYYNKYLKNASDIPDENDIFYDHKPTPAQLLRYIENCHTGQKLVENPVELRIENLGPIINTKFAEYVPVVSADENILMFTTRSNTTTGKGVNEEGRYYEDILISVKNDQGQWDAPKNLGPPINTKFDDACIGLSHDGKKLLIYNGMNGGDIFISENKNGSWSKPKRLDGDINSEHWEGSASFTIDENIMYFSSDRPGGFGGSDIYFSRKLANGKWGTAINLGPYINTELDEDAPQIHVDGKTLFFSSKGHDGMGGFDIFSSTLNLLDSTWSKPKNIGYPINTADDDIYFSLTADGSKGFFTSYRNDGYGEQDIYVMHRPLSSPTHVLLKGRIKDKNENPLEAYITLTRNKDQVIEKMTKSDPVTGKYSFEMEFDKDYILTVEAEGHFYFTENINIGKQPDMFEYVMNFNSGKDNTYVIEIFDGPEAVASNSPLDIQSIQKEGVRGLKIKEMEDLEPTIASLDLQARPQTVKSLQNETTTDYHATISKTKEVPFVQDRLLEPLEIGKKMVLKNIYFDFNKSVLKPESATELNSLYKLLLNHPSLQVEISGHTDYTGRKKYNQHLSEARATAVFNYLTTKGIDKNRIFTVGYGDTRPRVSNLTPEGRKINRRTEFEIINIDKSSELLIATDIRSRDDNSIFPTSSIKIAIGTDDPLPFKAHFLYNDGKYLTEYSMLRLNTILELAKLEKDLKLTIIGYEDFETEDSNKNLGSERAQTVYNYLVKNGLSKDRMEIKIIEDFASSKISSIEKGVKRRKVELYLSEN